MADKHLQLEQLAIGQARRLRQYLRRRVSNAADIPDLMQEVFLRFLRAPRSETIRVPEAYIFTIARHVAQQHQLASAASEPRVEIQEALAVLTSAHESDPALEVSAEQCLGELEDALRHMAPNVQATFLLYRRDGLSMDEISERLNISRPMAKKYLVKALVQFRKRLKDTE